MTKQRAIRQYCLSCSGDSPKEVTLCHLFDCPLWEYRCGCHIKSRQYQDRMKGALSRYPEEVEELRAIGINVSFFLVKGVVGALKEKNEGRVRSLHRAPSRRSINGTLQA